MAIRVGDTVKVLGHRNGYGEDISSWRKFEFNTGDTFVVGVVQDGDHMYPCPLIYPVGEVSDFWREDDLEVVETVPAPSRIQRIVRYREMIGIGLLEAKRMVEREDLLAEIDACRGVSDVKAVLRKVVDMAGRV